jgi:hypothetical protein
MGKTLDMNTRNHLASNILTAALAFATVSPAFAQPGGEVYYDDPYGPRYVERGYATQEYAPDPYSDETVSAFFDDLAPYGDWMYVADLGWVWRPRGVPRGWQPYTDGRWVWTDDGWTWISDWEWGWAPFHYGRWTSFDDDWVWVPGLEWAPAWVSWRHGDGWVGWAPLPPRFPRYREVLVEPYLAEREIVLPPTAYCFVEERVFLEPRIDHYIVPRYRNVTLVRATQNITHYSFAGGRVANRGLDVREVERFTRRPVRQYRIVDRDRPVKRGERVNVKDNEVAIFRPSFRGESGPRVRDQGAGRGWRAGPKESRPGFVGGPPDKGGEVRREIKPGSDRPWQGSQGAREWQGGGRTDRTEPRTPEAQKGAPFAYGSPGRQDSGGFQKGPRGNGGEQRTSPAPAWEPYGKRGEDRRSSREGRTPQPPTIIYQAPGAKDKAVTAPPAVPRYRSPEPPGSRRPWGREGKQNEAKPSSGNARSYQAPAVRGPQSSREERQFQPQAQGGTWRGPAQPSYKGGENSPRRSNRESTPTASPRQIERRPPELSRKQEQRIQSAGRPEPAQPRGFSNRAQERKTEGSQQQKARRGGQEEKQ